MPNRTCPPCFLALLAAILLGACTVLGPEHQTPALALPAAWSTSPAAAVKSPSPAPDLATWWQQLGDTTLTALVENALAANPDLRAARASVREARARRNLAGAQRLSSLGASASASAARSSKESGSGASSEIYGLGLDAAWEADLFGGLKRGEEAARADLAASEADMEAVQVSLVAEVALAYVDLRGSQARLAIARANLDSQQQTQQLTDWRHQAGLASRLDVEQARSSVEQTRAQIPSLETSRSEAVNRLAVLLGRNPGDLDKPLADALAQTRPLPKLPEQVATGIPAQVLTRRPDLIAADRRLAAETARVGEAQAARYPGLSLSASFGLEALNPADLFSGAAFTRSLLAGLSATLFDGGRLRQQVEIRNAIQEQALIAYESAVLTALKETENALSSLANLKQRVTALQAAEQAAGLAAQLARQRYEAGSVDFQTVLETERTRLTAQDSLAIAQADSVTALVRLYKVLGGGWQVVPASPSPPRDTLI
ncbi:MAG: efflux transporter outer membrane subunit [Pseudomonadota bacterium]